MVASRSTLWLVSIACVVLIALIAMVYFSADRPAQLQQIDATGRAPAAARPATADGSGPGDSAAASYGSLRRDLLSQPEDSRNHVLWLAILDAGFECDEIEHAGMPGHDAMGWLASCGSGVTYFIAVDDAERITVDEVPSGDFGLAPFPVREYRNDVTEIPGGDVPR